MEEKIPFFVNPKFPPQPDKPTVERASVDVVVINRKTDEVLVLLWPEFDWKTFISGGIEGNENPIEAAKREVAEETGYTNISYLKEIGKMDLSFYAAHKNVNRLAHSTALLFELIDEKQIATQAEETKNHSYQWIPIKTAADFININAYQYVWKRVLEIL